MKISIFFLLSIGLVNALERPGMDAPPTERKSPKSLDFSEVKPLSDRQREQIKPAQAEGVLEKSMPRISGAEPEPLVQGKMMPWLGVLGEPLNDTLKAQLGLESGVVLKIVTEGSPAFISGLRVHDILLQVDGQNVLDQDSLRAVIQSVDVEEEVAMRVISKGEEAHYKVKLVEKAVGSGASASRTLEDMLPAEIRNALSTPIGEALKGKGFGRILKDMGFEKLFDEISPKNFNLDFRSSNIIQMEDAEGSVKIQVVNGEKNVTVLDKEGGVQYQGPWDSEEDQAKAPEEMRARINNIDFSYKNHKLQLSPKEIR